MSFAGSEVPKRLVIPVHTYPDETMGDLVLRATAVNSYQDPAKVLALMGLSYKHPSALGITIIGEEARLAQVLGLPGGAGELQHLLYPPETGKVGWVRFFGTPMRWSHISSVHRRVSPISLRTTPYNKAVWSIKVFSFDPQTRETLLGECPNCNRAFRYMWTRGVAHCAYCTVIDEEGFVRGGVNLSEFHQPLIEVEDEESLDFVTGLVDPHPDVRKAFNPKLHADLSSFGRGDLFEFIVALACALTASPQRVGRTLDRPSTNAEYKRFTPSVLETVGRVVLNWPGSLHEVADMVRRDSARRPGHYGIQKELGPLLSITVDPHTHPGLRKMLYHALHDNMEASADTYPAVRRAENRYRSGYITKTDAAEKISGCSLKHLSKLAKRPEIETARVCDAARGPVLFKEAQLVELYDLRKRLVPSRELAADFGVPKLALRDLAKSGHFKLETGPVLDCLIGKEYYHREPANDLIRLITRNVRNDAPPSFRVRISNAVNRLVLTNTSPWPIIVQAIIDRRIDVWKIEGDLTGVMTSLAVADMGVLGDLLVSSGVEDLCDETTRLMQHEASLLLCTTVVNVCSLIHAQLLPRHITLRDIYTFKQSYMFTTDVILELRNRGKSSAQQSVHEELKRAGIRPVYHLKYGNKSLWLKEDVDAYVYGVIQPDGS